MADILIRGMEMPKTCSDCPGFVWDVNAVSSSPILAAQNNGTMVCVFTREEIWNTKRGDLCPLVPLPEGHGRLGDLDALSKEFEHLAFLDWNQKAAPYSWAYAYSEAQAAVDDSPTIVPAEKGRDDNGE